MTEIELEETIYQKLQEHLDAQPVGFPKSKSGVEIRVLKAFFTPEEAQIAIYLSYMPSSAKDVFRKLKRKKVITLEQTQAKLGEMNEKGLVIRYKDRKTGEYNYINLPFAVGFYELSVDNFNKEKAESSERYFREKFLDEMTKTEFPQIHTIPVNQVITPQHDVLSYDDIWKIIDNMSEPFVVAPCVCAQEKSVLGKECKHKLINRCITNSKWYLKYNHGKEISKQELIDLIKAGQKDGLVLQPGNYQKGTFLCMCCSCCCGVLSNAKLFDKPAQFLRSNYYSEVKADECTACSTCVDLCPMEAITITDTAHINLDRCIGCAVCVANCPSNAIQLIRKENVKEPPQDQMDLYSKLMQEKIERNTRGP